MKLIFFSFFIVCFAHNLTYSQQTDNHADQDTTPITLYEKRYNESYDRNIKKSRIKGVYIPKNLVEAHKELIALSPANSIEKFKNAEKNFVVGRLHYGLGRWMVLNWNFYDGSRYSHFLKNLGLSHPDDMARFTLLTFHDYLNNIDYDIEATVKMLVEERKLIFEEQRKN